MKTFAGVTSVVIASLVSLMGCAAKEPTEDSPDLKSTSEALVNVTCASGCNGGKTYSPVGVYFYCNPQDNSTSPACSIVSMNTCAHDSVSAFCRDQPVGYRYSNQFGAWTCSSIGTIGFNAPNCQADCSGSRCP